MAISGVENAKSCSIPRCRMFADFGDMFKVEISNLFVPILPKMPRHDQVSLK